MEVHGVAVVFRQSAHRIEHTAIISGFRGRNVFVQFGVLLARGPGDIPAAIDGDPQQPGFEVLLTLKTAFVAQELFKHILHHVLRVGGAAAIVHRGAEHGVAVSLYSQRKNFVFGQLSHKSLSLHYYEGYTAAEVGRMLGAPTNTVLSWLRRARAQLHTLLKEEIEDEVV